MKLKSGLVVFLAFFLLAIWRAKNGVLAKTLPIPLTTVQLKGNLENDLVILSRQTKMAVLMFNFSDKTTQPYSAAPWR